MTTMNADPWLKQAWGRREPRIMSQDSAYELGVIAVPSEPVREIAKNIEAPLAPCDLEFLPSRSVNDNELARMGIAKIMQHAHIPCAM